ncbi:hypothetical protein [Streptomyces vastus]|uniref:Uncharacterized protein n=1 Tax=Streptomyces vastus TaxID=285451 RepID=A0ABN3QLS2_9ACTN
MNRRAPHAETPGRSVPGRFRGPFTRWPRGADAVLAVAMFLPTMLLQEAPGDTMVVRPVTGILHPALPLFLVAGAALYRRRSRPLAVLCVVLVAWAGTLGSSHSTLGAMVIVALYSVGRHADDNRWGPLGVVAAIAGLTIDGSCFPSPGGTSSSAPSSCPGPGTSAGACGFAPGVPPGCSENRPPRPGGS